MSEDEYSQLLEQAKLESMCDIIQQTLAEDEQLRLYDQDLKHHPKASAAEALEGSRGASEWQGSHIVRGCSNPNQRQSFDLCSISLGHVRITVPATSDSDSDSDSSDEVKEADGLYPCASPSAPTHPCTRLDEACVQRAVQSLGAIQRAVIHILPLDQSADREIMSKLVLYENPKCFTRLFRLFVKKLPPPRRDCVQLEFASFVWAMCHMDKKSTAATLALLHCKGNKLDISGRTLKRIFKHVYCQTFTKMKTKTQTQTLDEYAVGLASEVVTYARGVADLTTGRDTLKCSAPHPTEAVCDECVIPVNAFVRFACKGQRSVLWPITMIQAHFRGYFFGEEFWSKSQDLRPLFEEHGISDRCGIKCKDVQGDATAGNIFVVTRKLLQWRAMYEHELSSASTIVPACAPLRLPPALTQS